MSRTGHYSYRRNRAAIVKASDNCAICGRIMDKENRYLVDDEGIPILDPVTGKRRLNPRYATADHRTPYSQGGSDSRSNLAAACFECNNKRGNRSSVNIIKTSGALR